MDSALKGSHSSSQQQQLLTNLLSIRVRTFLAVRADFFDLVASAACAAAASPSAAFCLAANLSFCFSCCSS